MSYLNSLAGHAEIFYNQEVGAIAHSISTSARHLPHLRLDPSLDKSASVRPWDLAWRPAEGFVFLLVPRCLWLLFETDILVLTRHGHGVLSLVVEGLLVAFGCDGGRVQSCCRVGTNNG